MFEKTNRFLTGVTVLSYNMYGVEENYNQTQDMIILYPNIWILHNHAKLLHKIKNLLNPKQ